MDAKTRLRKACDACRIRKVKCDVSGPPCRSCATLGILCTYARPSRRRGPPNRHAEALKKQKLKTHPQTSPDYSSEYPLVSNLEQSASSCHPPTTVLPASAEEICSLSTVRLLLDDFFTYIHPLVPIPHEFTFRAAFKRREDATSGTFLALLASMIGFLVASFPRQPKLRLKTEAERSAFPNSIALAKRCHDLAVQARGTGYLDRKATVYDAATSYFLGVCAGYIDNLRHCRVYLAECRTMLQVYDLCRSPTNGISVHGLNAMTALPTTTAISSDQSTKNLTDSTTMDLITQELGRRLFYVTLVGYQTLNFLDIKAHFPLDTPSDRYPPLPLEIDDEFIFSTHFRNQPVGRVSQLVGFNANVRVYNSNRVLLASEIAFGSGQIFDWEHQRSCLVECLQKAKSALVDVPVELSLFESRSISSAGSSKLSDDSLIFNHPYSQIHQQRRAIQYEIQKVNIYASQLCTRSYLVEKYWSLFEHFKRTGNSANILDPSLSISRIKTEPSSEAPNESTTVAPSDIPSQALAHARTDSIGRMMAEERKLVVKEFFNLLRTVNEINMEPNGASITSKIRQVASTLLDPITTTFPTEDFFTSPAASDHFLMASEAKFYLQAFIETLIRLENPCSKPTHSARLGA